MSKSQSCMSLHKKKKIPDITQECAFAINTFLDTEVFQEDKRM